MPGDAKTYELDANIILRFVLRDHEMLTQKAFTIMEAASEGRISLYCDPVIVAEVVWVLGSRYRVPPVEIPRLLEPILRPANTVLPNKQRYLRALKIYAETNAHFGDACACAAAIEDCEGRLFSFDRSLSKIEGIHRSETA